MEDGPRLVLFGGVPGSWFTAKEAMELIDVPTHFGLLTTRYRVDGKTATLIFNGNARRGGIVLRFPAGIPAMFAADAQPVDRLETGDVLLPLARPNRVTIRFE